MSESAYVRLEVDTISDGLKEALKGTNVDGKTIGLPVWTTTPWSLASNMVSLAGGQRK